MTEKAEIIANVKTMLRTVCATGMLQKEKGRLGEELGVLVEMMQKNVRENARVAQDQIEYQKRYNELVGRYDDVKDRYDKIVAAITDKEAKSVRLENFINELKDRDGIVQDFDNRLWGSLVDFVTVGKEKEITVTFRDGTEIMA